MAKPGRPMCDTRCQLFYRECAEKELRLKAQWFAKNKKRLYASAGRIDEFSRIDKKTASPPSNFLEYRKPIKPETKELFKPWRPAEEEDRFSLMRPIKPDIKNILYVPKDESFVSRKNYLRERYKEKPEDRYYYPLTGGFVYGWRLKDFPPYHPSKYGVRSVIQSSFYRKNASSLQRDPDWYRICQTGDPKNFNEIMTI